MVRLSQRAVHDALEFVHVASSLDATEPFPQPTIDLLARLVPADLISYNEWDTSGPPRLVSAVEQPAIVVSPDVVEARRTYCSSYPLSILRRNASRRALRISDFITLRELHRLDYYDAVLRPFRVEHQMRLWLPAPKGASRVFTFSRQRKRDFADRERSLLDLLRPYLIAIRERFEVCQAAATTSDDSLTDREEEILRLVARGKTNQEIASLLFVSPHTVRKHLENAYEKLGVHTRTAAVASAFARAN